MRLSPNPLRYPLRFIDLSSRPAHFLLLPAILFIPVIAPQAVPLGQQAAPPATQSAPAQPAAAQPASSGEPQPPSSSPGQSGPITEAQLQSRLVGKPLYLRGGWLGDSLTFTEHGDPVGHPATGSFTLSAIQIDKVHLTKHRIELEGYRYALHFLGALPYENDANSVDRIRITPKKKLLKISIDREILINSKKVKEKKKPAAKAPAATTAEASSESDAPAAASPRSASQQPSAVPSAASTPAAPVPETADQEADKPGEAPAADQASVTTTLSPAHAAMVLHQALDKIFANGLDAGMRARMPEFWQLYYQAQAAGVDFHPKDPAVLRSSAVDQQAKIVHFAAPASNDYAQASAIAGPALYRVVVGMDGQPQQIAVERPIGFGLDESAVAAIRKATFQPATKGGQPVAEALDLTVVFRIYSSRTAKSAGETAEAAATSDAAPAASAPKPALPGPYSVKPPPAPPQ